MKLPTQVAVLNSKPEPAKISAVADDLFWKPRGGLWTSTLDDEGGDWVRWLHGENYSLDDPRWGGDLWVLEPTDANIFVIATPENYNELADHFPHPQAALLRESEMWKTLRMYHHCVDWTEVAKTYDAVHMPDPRSHRFGLRYGMDDNYYDAGMFFDTCDCESTCWFKWCFEGEPVLLPKEMAV